MSIKNNLFTVTGYWFAGLFLLAFIYLLNLTGIIQSLHVPVFDGRDLYTLVLMGWGWFGFFGLVAYCVKKDL